MITLTPLEERIRDALVEHILECPDVLHACMTYKQIGDKVGHHHRGLDHFLAHVSMYEVEHGRPMLSALVVLQNEGVPGGGFARLAKQLHRRSASEATEVAVWRSERDEVWRFWKSEDPSRFVDAALNRIMAELVRMRKRLDQLN